MKKTLWSVAILLPLGIFVLTLAGCGTVDEAARAEQSKMMLESMRQGVDLNGPRIPDIEVGESAPATVGVDIHDKEIDLADYQGKVVLLSFWGGG